MGKIVPPMEKLVNLDPTNWEHQELARALKVLRCGSLCKHGHPWQLHGVLCSDGRVRCRVCSLRLGNAARRKRRTLEKLAKGED